MTEKRTPKKSDVFQIRLPPDTKRAFLEACRRNGRAASEVMRELAESYVRRTAELPERLVGQRPAFRWSLAMAFSSPLARAAAAVCLTAMLAYVAGGRTPSIAQEELRAMFAEIDADGDGRMSAEEGMANAPWLGPTIWMVAATSDVEESGPLVRDGVEELWFPSESRKQSDFIVVPVDAITRHGADTANYVRRRLITGFDRDGDGGVDFEEYRARYDEMIEATFARFDLDGDGRITAEEGDSASADVLRAADDQAAPHYLRGEHFATTDRDSDGVVTFDEFSVLHTAT